MRPSSTDPFARQHEHWAQWFGADWHDVRVATAARAEAAITGWALSDPEPFGTGAVGYVYRARLRSGDAVVLKVEPATTAWAPDAADRALGVWARAGLAPTVLASRDGGRTLLLQLVTPGTQLGEHTSLIEESFPVIADVARRLRGVARTPEDGHFPTISQYADADGWRSALARHHPDEIDELETLLALPGTTLIHNDLYQDNVLQSGDGWVVIDPKPVLADPHEECFALLAAAEYVTDIGVIHEYARLAELPSPQLLARWIRIRALIAIAQDSDGSGSRSSSAWIAHLRALAQLLDRSRSEIAADAPRPQRPTCPSDAGHGRSHPPVAPRPALVRTMISAITRRRARPLRRARPSRPGRSPWPVSRPAARAPSRRSP